MIAHLNNGTCTLNGTLYGIFNSTTAQENGIRTVYPSNDFLNNVGLQLSKANGIGDIGPIRRVIFIFLLQ